MNHGDIAWADVIVVMESEHKSRLAAECRQDLAFTPPHVLDIPDEYRYLDPELIEMFELAIPPLLEVDDEWPCVSNSSRIVPTPRPWTSRTISAHRN